MTPSRHVTALLASLLGSAVLAGCSSAEDAPERGATSSPESLPSTPTPSPSTPDRPTPRALTLTAHPQLAQVGPNTQPASRALSTLTVAVAPAQEGREVVLQSKRSGAWADVTSAEQDARGQVEFNAPYAVRGRVQTYRATVIGDRDRTSRSSAAVRTDRMGAPDFSDDFEGSALDTAWSNRLQGYLPESNRACSRADGRAVEMSGGTARLSVLLDPDRHGERCASKSGTFSYRLNGHISTEQSRAFKYGYFAARVKFQSRRGQHGAFWLQVKSRAALSGPATLTGSEIDVIEWFGNGQPQGGLTSFVYDYPTEKGRKTGGFLKNPDRYGDDWAGKFHVFSVQWTPEAYVYRIDGQETFRTSRGVSGRPEFMILSLQSSDYEIPYLERDSNLPQTMSVDWVRHWPL